MLKPSDIDKNVFSSLMEDYKDSKKGILRFNDQLGLHIGAMAIGIVSCVAMFTLKNYYPISEPGLIQLAQLAAFGTTLVAPLVSAIVGHISLVNGKNDMYEKFHKVLETRGLNPSEFTTYQSAKIFNVTMIDQHAISGSLLKHTEGFSTLGELANQRLHEPKKNAEDFTEDRKNAAFNQAVIGAGGHAIANAALGAATDYAIEQEELRVKRNFIIEYGQRRKWTSKQYDKALSSQKNDSKFIDNLPLEKVDTIAYYVEELREQVKKEFGDKAKDKYVFDELLEKRLEGMKKDPLNPKLTDDYVVNKVNEAKNMFLEAKIINDSLSRNELIENKKQIPIPKKS